MKRFEMFKHITVKQMLETLLTKEQIEQITPDITEFMNHDHKLPIEVLNVIVTKSLIMTLNKGNLPNAAYMRKVTESFRNQGATNLASAISKMDRDKEFALKQIRTMKPIEWLDDYTKQLEQMENY
ncbi:MAG: hypothetical protein K8Q99_02065 [Acholeplasmataceae bacterium]|nr:hypothetical protein [Acholeplasmataceae bacterium]MCD4826551.1 hypothetical protein [Acholeplasmataceae bacterium]